MRVAVIGTGYVGLVTGACLAHVGHHVTCLDVNTEKVRQLRNGKIPIFEPGLDELVAEEFRSGRLEFTDDYRVAVPSAQAVFICVGTPSLPSGQADTSAVEAAARSIGAHLGSQYAVVVNKSTVPVGSGDWVGMLVRQGASHRAGSGHSGEAAEGASTGGGTAVALASRPGSTIDFDVVSNPEFLREGTAIEDALHPDRIVVGAESERAVDAMRTLYAPLLERCRAAGHEVPFVVTDRASAEVIKYAANAFLATKISFINEIANICERVGADVRQVAQGIGLDHRIGRAFLSAGIGWGGSCFPKDLASLIHTAEEYGYEARLLQAAREVNAHQRMAVVRRLQEKLKLIKGKTIALWGLAFKPGTDDLRDAPALDIAARLLEMGAEVRAYDPQAVEPARRLLPNVELVSDPYAAAYQADAIVLVTEWPELLDLNWSRLSEEMRRPIVIDGRNALDSARLEAHGFDYCGIGR
ncbi:MAG: UDP-glucose dehydrogenase family protein [Armatimonadota bacterium]